MPIPLKRGALFLDLDGTLAPIAPTPAAVTLGRCERAIVHRAGEALAGRIAVISGRTIGEVDRILGTGLPCVAGIHGLQRRTHDGLLEMTAAHPDLDEARRVFGVIAQSEPRLILEDKGLSIALHYRQAPEAEAAVTELAERLRGRTKLVLQSGHMESELKTPGPDKGDALRAFMTEAPFINTAPVFIGDDVTDETGFAAAIEFNGFGILVGSERATLASMRLKDPEAVLGWIERSLIEEVFTVETLR
jgi:trehalose 6-phosphate phosphatase